MEFPFYYIFPPPCSEWFPLKFVLFTWMVSFTLLSLLYYLQVAGWCECMWKKWRSGWLVWMQKNEQMVGWNGWGSIEKVCRGRKWWEKVYLCLGRSSHEMSNIFHLDLFSFFSIDDKVVLLLWKLIACPGLA